MTEWTPLPPRLIKSIFLANECLARRRGLPLFLPVVVALNLGGTEGQTRSFVVCMGALSRRLIIAPDGSILSASSSSSLLLFPETIAKIMRRVSRAHACMPRRVASEGRNNSETRATALDRGGNRRRRRAPPPCTTRRERNVCANVASHAAVVRFAEWPPARSAVARLISKTKLAISGILCVGVSFVPYGMPVRMSAKRGERAKTPAIRADKARKMPARLHVFHGATLYM